MTRGAQAHEEIERIYMRDRRRRKARNAFRYGGAATIFLAVAFGLFAIHPLVGMFGVLVMAAAAAGWAK